MLTPKSSDPFLRPPLRGDDPGSALMAVIGVMAVTLVIAMTVAGMSLNALNVTSSTRASMQAQAAAHSGVDVVVAGIASRSCVASVTRASNPAFSASVAYSTSASGESWVSGCPGTGARRVKITSAGTASAPALAGNSSGDSRTVEAVYEVPQPSTAIEASGAAIYANSGATFGSNFALSTTAGTSPRVEAFDGDAVCAGNNWIEASILVPSGALRMQSNCKIRGDAWSAAEVKLAGNSVLDGNLWAQGGVTVTGNGAVTGTVTAPTVDTSGNGAVGRTALVSGTPMPSVRGWTNFGYRAADWVDASNQPFAETTMGGAGCQLTAAVLAGAGNGTKSVILDAQTCPALTISGNTTLDLTRDVVVVAKAFDFRGNTNVQAATNRRLWFITPDATGAGADCPAGGTFAVSGNFSMDTHVSAMIYTPCALTLGANTVWRGQAYAKTSTMESNTTFTYSPMGLPGVNLTNRTSGAVGATPPLGPVISQRDVQVG